MKTRVKLNLSVFGIYDLLNFGTEASIQPVEVNTLQCGFRSIEVVRYMNIFGSLL